MGDAEAAASDMNTTEAYTCRVALLIDPDDTEIVGENLASASYTFENISEALYNATSPETAAYYIPSITQDISDARSERVHFYDSAALLVIMALLFLTVITIWVFKVRRLRVMHETGLSLLYGEQQRVFSNNVPNKVYVLCTIYALLSLYST